ncbi:MAG TPA: hypothetical protein VGK14_03840 [Novimethylophilus sp.]|jgi:hypothetical protein|uniref:hypothetical protein n=1 Tax=Novimethylophilus sp. TaxID=2137426 RepID=UPI002F3F467C
MNFDLKKKLLPIAPYLFFALLALSRVLCAGNWRVDSDEPQHLHVIWGWANGLLQYRDIFDNHAPVFHILFTPVYRLIGERPDILVWMRIATIPLFFAALWAVYLVGRELYSRRVGMWAAIFTGLYPRFFLTSLEFRADDLWIVPWLLALAVLVQKPLRASRMLVAGVLLGTALSISMKTSLLLTALGLATLGALALQRAPARLPVRQYVGNALPLLAGMVVVPAALTLFFFTQGALSQMYYAVIQHNVVPGLGHWKRLQDCAGWSTLILLPLTVGGAYLIQRFSPDADLRLRRLVIFLTYGLAVLALCGFWPLVTRQDFLPLVPLLIVIATGFLLELRLSRPSLAMRSSLTLVIVAMAEIVTLVVKEKPWHQHALPENRLLADVLQLTRPGETIMDLKGETVFRSRPFYYVLEGVTRKRIELGMIKDSIPEDVVRTQTAVATLDSMFFPSRGRDFLNRNFLPVGQLRVAGQMLTAQNVQTNGDILFDIHIPTSYMMMAENGAVAGWLDGTPYQGPRRLGIGQHIFRTSTSGNGRLAVLWAPAIERGYSPFVAGHSI